MPVEMSMWRCQWQSSSSSPAADVGTMWEPCGDGECPVTYKGQAVSLKCSGSLV